MQYTSNLYKEILSGTHRFECKLSINGVEYGEDVLVQMKTSGGLFHGSPSVGNAVSRQIDVSLRIKSASVPRMAELRPYVRAVNDTQHSEWLPKGVFYVDTREYNEDNGVLHINGYDKMLSLEQPYITVETAWEDMTDIRVINALLQRFGLTLDSRTVIDKGYEVGFPNTGDAAYTCREVLGFIAAMYGANWIITDEGKLRLVAINGIPTETYYMCDENGDFITFGGVRISVR